MSAALAVHAPRDNKENPGFIVVLTTGQFEQTLLFDRCRCLLKTKCCSVQR